MEEKEMKVEIVDPEKQVLLAEGKSTPGAPSPEKAGSGEPGSEATVEEPKEEDAPKLQMPWELVSDGTSLVEVQIISTKDEGLLLGDPDLLKKVDAFIKKEGK